MWAGVVNMRADWLRWRDNGYNCCIEAFSPFFLIQVHCTLRVPLFSLDYFLKCMRGLTVWPVI